MILKDSFVTSVRQLKDRLNEAAEDMRVGDLFKTTAREYYQCLHQIILTMKNSRFPCYAKKTPRPDSLNFNKGGIPASSPWGTGKYVSLSEIIEFSFNYRLIKKRRQHDNTM